MTIHNLTVIPPSESDSDDFAALMHRLFSATQRLKLAADRLGDSDGLSEDHIPAAFVVEEAMLALEQIHDDLKAWGMKHWLSKAVQS